MQNESVGFGGVMTFWKTASFYDARVFKLAFDNLGLADHAPKLSTPDANLKYALGRVFDKTCQLIRPKKNGFAVVEETQGELGENNTYRERYSFWLEQIGTARQLQMEPFNSEVGAAVASAFNEFCDMVTGNAVTASLVGLVARYNGTVLRPTGGIYWLPDSAVMAWADIAQIVERAAVRGHPVVYLVRHRLDHDSVRAVRDGLVDEITDETKKIEADCQEESLGWRALEARRERANVLIDKVAAYEGLLDVGLASLREKLEHVRGAAAVAALRAAAGRTLA